MAVKVSGTTVIDSSRNIVNVGTVDGRDVSADGSKLDGINQGVATTDSPSFAGLTVDTNTLYVDAANNRVGIGTSTPSTALEVVGTVTATNINLGGTAVTATAAEINILDGLTATTAELNYVDGVTSSIQTQLDNKQPLDSDLTALVGLGTTGILVRTGTGTAVTRAVAVGTGLTVTNATGVNANPTISASIASQVEAEAGTNNTRLMTPQRTKQAINANVHVPEVLRIYESQSSGVVSSQTFTVGAWNTRVLNTTDGSISGASLSSNEITLPAGTYLIEAWAPAWRVSGHKSRIYNVTTSSVELVGQNAYGLVNNSQFTVTNARLSGRLVLATTTVIRLEHYVQAYSTAVPTVGAPGTEEVYAEVLITKF